MNHRKLANTDLRVSRVGLGCGGASRLGLAYGASEAQAIELIRIALDLGVNLLDTAAVYGTEGVIGKAIHDIRDQVVLCTKLLLPRRPHNLKPGSLPERLCRQLNERLSLLICGDSLRAHLEQCLERLHSDYVDILYLHAVTPGQYPHALDLLPLLKDLRREGTIRAIGISEAFERDPQHKTVQQAVTDGCWDVVMLKLTSEDPGLNATVLQPAILNHTGVIAMGAALPQRGNNHAEGYRAALQIAGVDVVLMGTGNREHLRANMRALKASQDRLGEL